MKKIIAMLVCVLMLAACLPTAAFAVDAGITTGDVNGDEAVDVKDVVLMIRFLTGWDVGISEEYGDFDGNGRIDMRDLILLIRYILSSTPEPEPEPEPEPKPEPDPAPSKIGEVLALVNAERAKNGLSPLTLDTELTSNANIRAKEIVEQFSHTRPNGESCDTAVTVDWMHVGENIAMGYPTPEAVMNGWMNSDGHRKNILNGDFTKIGIGVCSSGGAMYWVQLFVG